MATTKSYEVTQSQVDACTRVTDLATQEVYYLVSSQTTIGKVYKVACHKVSKCLSCTCPAGNPPTDVNGYFLYAPRTCWHTRAAKEHSRRYHEARKQEQRETYNRVMSVTPFPWTEYEIARDLAMNSNRAFRFMR